MAATTSHIEEPRAIPVSHYKWPRNSPTYRILRKIATT